VARRHLHRRAAPGAVSDLDEDWPTYARVDVSNLVSYRAGELAERCALRGYDAVHLASAARLNERFDDLRFMTFDDRLVDAAREAALPVYGGETNAGREVDGDPGRN